MRNPRILNNLRAIAPNPQDRLIVIYGAGHGCLLNQQARELRAFEVTDTLSNCLKLRATIGRDAPTDG